nr:hypothetical protein [bacterium]
MQKYRKEYRWACLICMLVLVCGCMSSPFPVYSAPQSSAPADAVEQEPYPVEFTRVFTRYGLPYPAFDQPIVIRSEEQLQQYVEEASFYFDFLTNGKYYTLEDKPCFMQAIEKYDASYFSSKVLIIVPMERGGYNVSYPLKEVVLRDGKLQVVFQQVHDLQPKARYYLPHAWQALVEIEASLVPEEVVCVFDLLPDEYWNREEW